MFPRKAVPPHTIFINNFFFIAGRKVKEISVFYCYFVQEPYAVQLYTFSNFLGQVS